MKRTQLYINEEESTVLNLLAQQRRKTISELVREAIRKTYLGKRSLDPIKILDETAGLWKDRQDLGRTSDYLRKVREDTRLDRFGTES